MSLHVAMKRSGSALLVRVEGELDMASAAQLRDPIEQAWTEDSALHHLVLSVKKVSFLDSAGIAVILGRYRAAAGRGGRLIVAEATPRVKRMLEISGALRFVELADQEGEAMARLAPTSRPPRRRRRRRAPA